jgi:hypothetical protein
VGDALEFEGVVEILADKFDLFEGNPLDFFLLALRQLLLAEFDDCLLLYSHLFVVLLSKFGQLDLKVRDGCGFFLFDRQVLGLEIIQLLDLIRPLILELL